MSLQSRNWVKIQGANKTQAMALAIEFWTSQGFKVHSNSYNCIVFRRNGYGSIGKLIDCVFIGGEISFEESPTELTLLCQVLPDEANYDLTFKFQVGIVENSPGDFSDTALSWCKEFAGFCHKWMHESLE